MYINYVCIKLHVLTYISMYIPFMHTATYACLKLLHDDLPKTNLKLKHLLHENNACLLEMFPPSVGLHINVQANGLPTTCMVKYAYTIY